MVFQPTPCQDMMNVDSSSELKMDDTSSTTSTTSSEDSNTTGSSNPGLFLYLAQGFEQHGRQKRPICHVGKSRSLSRRLEILNGSCQSKAPKNMRRVSAPLEHVMIIGPFQRHATDLRRLWRKRSRGIPSRIRYGLYLAAATHAQCVILNESLVPKWLHS